MKNHPDRWALTPKEKDELRRVGDATIAAEQARMAESQPDHVKEAEARAKTEREGAEAAEARSERERERAERDEALAGLEAARLRLSAARARLAREASKDAEPAPVAAESKGTRRRGVSGSKGRTT